jgi:hypothetical protein
LDVKNRKKEEEGESKQGKRKEKRTDGPTVVLSTATFFKGISKYLAPTKAGSVASDVLTGVPQSVRT